MNQSVLKAFEILSFVVEHPQRMSLNEMSRRLKMNKTTLFRFLSTLEATGTLSKKDEVYTPGLRLFELGSKVPLKQLLIDKIHPLIARLTAGINETVNLGMLSGNQVLYLDKSESNRSLQIQTSVGNYTALHATGLGKSILSIQPIRGMNALLKQLEFEKKTDNTITEPAVLRKQIEAVWENGYSTDYEELEEGLFCVAVPLLIEKFNFYGAISCSGPNVRFTPEYMTKMAAKLKETVVEIKKQFS
ncbi:MAG: IclR family transcriptional regulator [bacterium]|nr:IclR family transcriptional regulator [bacterium]